MEPLQQGAVLRERYRVEARVETGPHENLYRVRDDKFSTEWAMREFDASRLVAERRAEAAAGFGAEADRLAQMRHQGMAQVVDHFIDGDRAYVLTEWVDGQSLERLMAAGPIPLEQVADLGAKLLDVVYFFHTGYDPVSIRVLSPRTVWVTRDDEIKLYDYGLGAWFDPRRYGDGQYRYGEAGYVAPEHHHGSKPDLPMDIYSAGVLLWQAATGRVPTDGALPSARSLNPAVPESLDRVISKAVNPDPAARHTDVGEFKHDLMAVAEGFAPDASPSAGATASTDSGPVPAAPPSASGQIVGSRRSGGCAPVLALIVAALAWALA
jgi:serine/threonine-protein kinase